MINFLMFGKFEYLFCKYTTNFISSFRWQPITPARYISYSILSLHNYIGRKFIWIEICKILEYLITFNVLIELHCTNNNSSVDLEKKEKMRWFIFIFLPGLHLDWRDVQENTLNAWKLLRCAGTWHPCRAQSKVVCWIPI